MGIICSWIDEVLAVLKQEHQAFQVSEIFLILRDFGLREIMLLLGDCHKLS